MTEETIYIILNIQIILSKYLTYVEASLIVHSLLARRPAVRWSYYLPTKTISPIFKAAIIAASILVLRVSISFDN